jgi:hypothetical protein
LKNFLPESFSYGVELEYGNCWRGIQLTDGAKWNCLDNTCVNSTGIANDPQGKIYEYGGEINTRPTNTISEQIEHIQLINKTLIDGGPEPIVNYRSNLHIHIRVPGLNEDLESCKKLLQYIKNYQQVAFDIVESIPTPDRNKLSPEIYKWAVIRQKRRYKSHQYKLPKARVEAMLASKTTKEFFEEHAPLSEKGRMWYFSPRAGINLRQMWEGTNTVEFRHFPGTLNLIEIESCLRWCRNFLDTALNNEELTPRDIYYNSKYTFPKFEEYEYETEQVYQWTNFDGNSRSTVKNRLDNLRKHINIDDIENVSSKQVYEVMKILQETLN